MTRNQASLFGDSSPVAAPRKRTQKADPTDVDRLAARMVYLVALMTDLQEDVSSDSIALDDSVRDALSSHIELALIHCRKFIEQAGG